MGQVIAALAASSYTEVEVIGLKWRISRIRSADLAKVGVAAFAIAGVGGGDAEQAAKAMTPEQAEKLAGYQEAVVCAGVRGVAHDDSGFEDVTLLLSEARANPAEGRLWIGAIPTKAITELFTAIMELSTDEGGAAERLASFRRTA